MQFKCDCHSVKCIKTNRSGILNQFENVKKNCPALREIFVPEDYWPEFSKKVSEPLDEAGHYPITLSAYKNGNLDKITIPVHAHLLDGEKPKKNLTPQYKQDLIDNYMSKKTDTFDRFRGARGFNGKLAELITSSWIECQGWKIKNLEALGGLFDIEAISPQGSNSAIEVKYIGLEDWQFELALKSLQSHGAEAAGFSVSPGYNYILFRTYEAAKQLEKFSGDRYVFIVISDLTWENFEEAIECNRIRHPLHFFEFSKWKGNVPDSFAESINKYPNIEKEISEVLNQIKELWLIKDKHWEYTLNKIIKKES